MSRNSTGSGSRPAIDFKKLFFENVGREMISDLLRKDGEFLLRRSAGGRVLSVCQVIKTEGKVRHYKFGDHDRVYFMDEKTFPTLEQLIAYYYDTGTPLARDGGPKLLHPVYNTFDMIDSKLISFKKVLGKGNFGEVWEAVMMPERETVAIKILGNASEKERAECMSEAKLMSMMHHENVVALRGLSLWKPNPTGQAKLLIVLEFCNYGALEKLLEKNMIEDRGKVRALLDSAKGIEYLHTKDIIHRDIASRNCLVHRMGTRFIVKVADFGLSRLAPEHYELVTKRRMPIYATAPDTMKVREWTSASDVYSYGILMLEVYNSGKNPYEQHYVPLKTNPNEVLKQLMGGFVLPTPASMPRELADMCNRCLRKAPERPTMSELVMFLKQFYNGMILP